MHLAIIRSSSYVLSQTVYNMQEVGLAQALLDYNISSDIYMAGNVKKAVIDTITEKNNQKIRLFYLPFYNFLKKQALFPSLFNFLNKTKYSLIQIHEYDQLTSLFVSIYGEKKNIPVILYQGIYQNYKRIIPRILQFIYDSTLLRIAHKCIHSSIAKTNYAKEYLHTKGFKIVSVCPIGLNINQFANEEFIDWREKCSIPKEAYILLYVGIIEKRRNVDFLINLFSELSKQRDDIYLLITGLGPDASKCRKLVNDLFLSRKIYFLGQIPQAQLPFLYRSSSLFILPSSYEIYGMAILEAMFFGVPVITTKTAGSLEIIEDEISGIIIDNLNIKKWKEMIIKILSDNRKYELITFNAKRRIKEKFLWNKVAKRYADIYIQYHSSAHH